MKKAISIISALGLTISMLAGCSPAKSVSPSSAPTTGKKDVTLSYMVSQGWLTDTEKQLGAKFEAETGIKIDYQVIPADQYFNVLMTKLNAGEAPDIFGSQSGKFDIVSQLNIEKNGVDLTNEEWVKRLDPLVKEQLSTNNKTYGLMIYDVTPVYPVLYNKKIFASLNLEVPKTYEEFKNVCQKIKDSGVTPIYEPVSDGWHHVLWFPDLGPAYEKSTPGLTDKLNTNKATFADSAVMEKSISQLQEMAKLGFFGKNFLSDSTADLDKNMADGKYAMTLAQISEVDLIAKAVPGTTSDTFGFFTPPLVDNQILSYNPAGPSKFISSGSKHIEEAKEYFKYLTTQENLQFAVDNDATVIALGFTGLKDQFSPEAKEFIASSTDKGTVYQTQIKYLNPQWMDIGKDLTAMFTTSLSHKDVLKNIDKRRSAQAKAAKDPAWTK